LKEAKGWVPPLQTGMEVEPIDIVLGVTVEISIVPPPTTEGRVS